MKQESTFFKRKQRALHKIHIKTLELTAKTAARQEYSTGINEAQEYSKWKGGACLSPTQEC